MDRCGCGFPNYPKVLEIRSPLIQELALDVAAGQQSVEQLEDRSPDAATCEKPSSFFLLSDCATAFHVRSTNLFFALVPQPEHISVSSTSDSV